MGRSRALVPNTGGAQKPLWPSDVEPRDLSLQGWVLLLLPHSIKATDFCSSGWGITRGLKSEAGCEDPCPAQRLPICSGQSWCSIAAPGLWNCWCQWACLHVSWSSAATGTLQPHQLLRFFSNKSFPFYLEISSERHLLLKPAPLLR